jgi:hypothetical protein
MAHIDVIVDDIGQVTQPCARSRIIPVNETNQAILLENGVMLMTPASSAKSLIITSRSLASSMAKMRLTRSWKDELVYSVIIPSVRVGCFHMSMNSQLECDSSQEERKSQYCRPYPNNMEPLRTID